MQPHTPGRELRLLQTFVALLEDHQKDFAGFVRDIENVRYCHTPIDSQQINRCEYALRNMEMRLLTIQTCIASSSGEVLDQLVTAKNEWLKMKARVNDCLTEIHRIVASTTDALRPIRATVEGR